MNRIDPHEGQTEIKQGVKILLDNNIDGIMEDAAALIEVTPHFLFEVWLHFFKLGRKLFDILIEVPRFGTVAEVDRVEGIEFDVPERQVDAAIAGELFKLV